MAHRRTTPHEHAFVEPVSMVWLDPDHPEELFGHGPLWSARRPAPLRFRRDDYGVAGRPLCSAELRDACTPALGRRPAGPVRTLTQPRRWGWLFNPLTVHVVWDGEHADPVAAVAEVTNTPWKERHRYAVALVPHGDALTAHFAKRLHVSPFLDEDYDYELALRDGPGGRLRVDLDVVRPGDARATLLTRLDVTRTMPDRASRSRFLWRHPLATHRVSAAIHWHAARLTAKRVPFVAHPRRRAAPTDDHPAEVRRP